MATFASFAYFLLKATNETKERRKKYQKEPEMRVCDKMLFGFTMLLGGLK